MKKLIILQTAMPDYRKKFFSFLKKKLSNHLALYAGKEYFQPSVRTDFSIPIDRIIHNHYIFGRRLLIQKEIGKLFSSHAVLVMELNPRIITNWLLLLARKLTGKKTVVWGHAWPRKGKKSKTDLLRHLMRLLASEIIVYTHSQKKELAEKMPRKTIHVAPNALYYTSEMLNNPLTNKQDVIYVGRLVADKKPFLLLQAFHMALEKLPAGTHLHIVGDGPQKNKLEDYIKKHRLENRILMHGHQSAYHYLKKLYDRSLCSVSPGYIGLSVTQSFSFGVPMIVSRTENHSPEIEAVKEDFNAVYFRTDDIKNLSETLIEFFRNKDFWESQRDQIVAFCKKNYSVENMAQSFINLIKG